MSCRPMGDIDTKLGIFLFTAKHRGIVGFRGKGRAGKRQNVSVADVFVKIVRQGVDVAVGRYLVQNFAFIQARVEVGAVFQLQGHAIVRRTVCTAVVGCGLTAP